MTERMENALRHIKTSVDVDPWAVEEVERVFKAYEQTQDRPTGHWIWQTEDKYQCSCCGEVIRVKEVMGKPQYITCPMCDAKMGVSE